MVVAGLIATGINYYQKNTSTAAKDTTLEESTYFGPKAPLSTAPKTLNKLYKARKDSNAKFWVTVRGIVIKILKDDLIGTRHQKFLLKIDDDFTLLISHNIDLAPRAPISQGSAVSVSGLYEWNKRGGLIHWTHHDPKGKRKGGWIKIKNKKYY